jgi:RHS repeat-associated protein
MYDEKGQTVWETRLDIYGKVRTFAGRSLSDCPFRYQGQYEDSETGLYYNRFRYYSPEDGMYLSQDPIGLAGNNPTLYGYVKDVNSWVDVLGLIIVYRAVNSAQEANVKAGMNIQPKDINATYSIQNHVENGRLNTQYISTTKKLERAKFYAKSNNSTIIAIDTDKIDPVKVIDISNGIDPLTGKPLKGKAFGYSTKDAEVLIVGEIPEVSYTIVGKCP